MLGLSALEVKVSTVLLLRPTVSEGEVWHQSSIPIQTSNILTADPEQGRLAGAAAEQDESGNLG